MSIKKIVKDIDSIIAIYFIAIAISFFIGARNPLLQKSMTDAYGPTFYPNIFASVLFICSIVILAGRFKACTKDTQTEAKQQIKTPRPLLLLFGLTITCPVILNYLGFIVMGIVSIFCFCKILTLSMKESVLLSIGLTVAVYVLFDVVLKVQLPAGMLF